MQITFQPYINEDIELLEPEPAIKHLPNWYKSMKPHFKGKKDTFNAEGHVNLTVKRCNPFGDALGAGYFILLENSISINKNPEKPNEPEIIWRRGGNNAVSTHHINQISPKIIPEEYYSIPFKFNNFWSIQTPKNYSVLITHPLNRTDLPFYTFSGVVDTDTYYTAVNLPFLLRRDFEGIIEAGTPIAQVIPFKRESWSSFFKPFSLKFYNKQNSIGSRYVTRWYKKLNWNRKEYK